MVRFQCEVLLPAIFSALKRTDCSPSAKVPLRFGGVQSMLVRLVPDIASIAASSLLQCSARTEFRCLLNIATHTFQLTAMALRIPLPGDCKSIIYRTFISCRTCANGPTKFNHNYIGRQPHFLSELFSSVSSFSLTLVPTVLSSPLTDARHLPVLPCVGRETCCQIRITHPDSQSPCPLYEHSLLLYEPNSP